MKIYEVRESKLQEILDLAREGEHQLVEFNKDQQEMAKAAARLSKSKCSDIIVQVLEILTGE